MFLFFSDSLSPHNTPYPSPHNLLRSVYFKFQTLCFSLYIVFVLSLSVCLSVSLSLSLSIYLSIYLSLCLSVFIYLLLLLIGMPTLIHPRLGLFFQCPGLHKRGTTFEVVPKGGNIHNKDRTEG